MYTYLELQTINMKDTAIIIDENAGNIGKLGYIDWTIPDLRWVSDRSRTSPIGSSRTLQRPAKCQVDFIICVIFAYFLDNCHPI